MRARVLTVVSSSKPEASGLRNTAIWPGQGRAWVAISGWCGATSSRSCGRFRSSTSGDPNTTGRVSAAGRGLPGGRS